MKKIFALLLCALCVAPLVAAQPLTRVAPQKVGIDPERMLNADRIINDAVNNKEIPGAVLAVVKDGKMAYLKAYGNRRIVPDTEPMTANTIFDMASCSKSLGTAVCFMTLIEKGYVRLQDAVSTYIPEFSGWTSADGKSKSTIRIEHLLTHTSGIPAYVTPNELRKHFGEKANSDSLIKYIATCKRDFEPGTDFQYSCLNFITLQRILEQVSGMSLRDYARKYVFEPLGMKHTDYLPCHLDEKSGLWVNDQNVVVTDDDLYTTDEKTQSSTSKGYYIAPTEKQAANPKICLTGQVHDPLAREINLGISGNAGLFTTAEDVAILCAALQNGGELNGVRILSPLTVKAMRTVPRDELPLGRALGWDLYSPYASNVGNLFSPETYGHTGYTGTSVIIDPVNDVSVILLTNRAHPDDEGGVVRLRTLVANAVAGAVIDTRKGFSDDNKASTELYFPYYYTRFMEFMDQPAITENDIVMLGNSLTEGGKDWGKRLGWKNVVNRGIIGDEINGIYDRLHQILPGKPKKIYLLSGVNDVSHHLSTDEIVARMERLLSRIQAESPSTEIVLQSLLPIDEGFRRYKNLNGKTYQIPEINARLAQLAKKKGIRFINLFPLFEKPGTNVLRKELTTDGLHLNEEGYKIWTKAILDDQKAHK
ncbi:MAG: serine hydrolase [Muribaculaceae bacterium]